MRPTKVWGSPEYDNAAFVRLKEIVTELAKLLLCSAMTPGKISGGSFGLDIRSIPQDYEDLRRFRRRS